MTVNHERYANESRSLRIALFLVLAASFVLTAQRSSAADPGSFQTSYEYPNIDGVFKPTLVADEQSLKKHVGKLIVLYGSLDQDGYTLLGVDIAVDKSLKGKVVFATGVLIEDQTPDGHVSPRQLPKLKLSKFFLVSDVAGTLAEPKIVQNVKPGK